jgi:hypothetical protein
MKSLSGFIMRSWVRKKVPRKWYDNWRELWQFSTFSWGDLYYISQKTLNGRSRNFWVYSNLWNFMLLFFWVFPPCRLYDESTRRQNPEQHHHPHCRENLKSHNVRFELELRYLNCFSAMKSKVRVTKETSSSGCFSEVAFEWKHFCFVICEGLDFE